MDPAQLLVQLQKKRPAAGYLFLGNELFSRDGCRKALLEAALPPGERESGLAQYDLAEASLQDVIEDARTLSLFAGERMIVGYNAENVLPKGRETEDEAQDQKDRSRVTH